MKDNYCVIMCGGIGSRFWPFSREIYPKQFLDFMGTGRSLLQLTVDRFKKIIPQENIIIATNNRYEDLVKEQLPEFCSEQILLEPKRRNTAATIAYAAYHIKAVNPKANIVVSPSDHLILKEDEFCKAIAKGLQFVKENEALATLGIKPNRVETGYGYIQADEDVIGDFMKVKTFTEKPDHELAKIFVESGEFYWNSGLFFWNIDAIMTALQKFMPEITTRFDTGIDFFGTEKENEFIFENYPCCPNISIDYGIMEKADNVYMLAADFGWADLGTWNSLFELAPKDASGNACLNTKTLTYEASNNVVAVENKGRLVVVQGVDDCIIAESGNVLLICKREDEERIKQFVADANLGFGDEYN
ncbi:MAG: mannose-1-phosphate guanylyltransferase [Tannerellaceae bacterium]